MSDVAKRILLTLASGAYLASPIDLIPDFIPVLGYLDDVVLVPLGIALVVRMIPTEVMAECRAKAEIAREEGPPLNWTAAAVIVMIWLGSLALVVWLVGRLMI